MLTVIIAVVAIILLTIAIVWLIDKFVPKKLKPILNLLLWVLIIFLGYITYESVAGELRFKEIKDDRYQVVVDRLLDIRNAQVAYKDVNGKYTDKYENLIKFIDTAKVPITERRDSTVLDEEKTKRFNGIEYFKTLIVVDTLDYYSVKDSLFKNIDYKNIMNVGAGEPGAKFELKAGSIDDIPVFEASVDKSVILYDQDKNLVSNEKQTVSVDGVNGPKIVVGSMNEVKTTGNWPKNFSKKE
ncbi:hypothetical protein BTO05_03285 [Winogradskyella sp. PC-19]|jgi:hypothetical protein|uniref:hypothetical protein n=1 Tax=unclassified Winogradskyella TaxID=2615021 RepID=UPI000B3D320F|nr:MULTISPECIES: hypothetical protein [unclassified Winogradskyella]ARV08707.1 hypothetical protein BTO05_03285 [Winogradskyella sp. PC-19]